jgi:glycosyltransferase involved in cell wall biosynthesis
LELTNVTFMPSVPKNEMDAVMAASDACLAILKPIEMYKTTYPNKVFDYMAAGRPVLLAIDGVARQVVEQAQAGIFCLPGDPAKLAEAVRELAANPVHARQMGANGRRYIEEHFARLKLADQLVDLLEKLGNRL